MKKSPIGLFTAGTLMLTSAIAQADNKNIISELPTETTSYYEGLDENYLVWLYNYWRSFAPSADLLSCSDGS